MIVVIDYGVGNIASVLNMLKRVGAKAKASDSREDIEQAEKLILPGVGAFDAGMQTLRKSGLVDVLTEQVMIKRKPVMGVCLGSQMLGLRSEEERNRGLDGSIWIASVSKGVTTERFHIWAGIKCPRNWSILYLAV